MSPLRKGMSSPVSIKNKFKQAVRKVTALNNLTSLASNSQSASGYNEQLMIPKAQQIMKSSTLLSSILNNNQVVMGK